MLKEMERSQGDKELFGKGTEDASEWLAATAGHVFENGNPMDSAYPDTILSSLTLLIYLQATYAASSACLGRERQPP
jgi:hypothetical protein